MCMLCRSLFVILSFFTMCCLSFFTLRIFITRFVSSTLFNLYIICNLQFFLLYHRHGPINAASSGILCPILAHVFYILWYLFSLYCDRCFRNSQGLYISIQYFAGLVFFRFPLFVRLGENISQCQVVLWLQLIPIMLTSFVSFL